MTKPFAAAVALLVTTTVTVFAQDSFTLKKRAAAEHSERYGDVSLGAVVRTDERYNRNGLFQGPRGWAYWNYLPDPKTYQNSNLWPDQRPRPHFWMMDSQTVLFGEQDSFGGVEARWVARLPLLTALEAAKASKPYKIFNPKKTQRMEYAKGKPVYELVDPDGNVYVLQAHEARFPIETLDKLGEQLKPPKGWQFRTRTLSEDLVLDLKSDETIYAIGDEFHQYWTRIPKSK